MITSSVTRTRLALGHVDVAISDLGMEFSPNKWLAVSLVPVGAVGRIKVVEDPLFEIADSPAKQMQFTDAAKYLAMCFRNAGAERHEIDIDTALQRIGNAPLKPQQRLIALRTHLLPRYVHGLELGGSSRHLFLRILILKIS